MDHDRLFKQLLREFFADFLRLFLPQVVEYIDLDSVEFLDKEILTDLTGGEKHEVDLLVKCRFRGGQAFLLIHVETQASSRGEFGRRMFIYCARLTESYNLPVYPIALFTFDEPYRPENDTYEMSFPDLVVLTFRFRAIQLNRLNWRDFVRNPNPVAAALMTKMRIAPEDRPRVKLECLLLLATLKLDPARQALIRDFMDSYLRLSAAEMKVYDQELKTIDPPEQEAVMQIVNEWEARGEARGEARARVELVLSLIRRRFGEVPVNLRDRVRNLDAETLQALAESLFDLTSMTDVEAWVVAKG